jgi:hypothetical protein
MPCDVLITRPRNPTECLKSSKPKLNGEFYGGRPRPKLGLYSQKVRKSLKERPLGRPRHRRQDNIKSILKILDGRVWSRLMGPALSNTVMNFQVL